jgi:predicted Ser/Thr protein kinase
MENVLSKIANKFNKDNFQKLNEEMSFSDYLSLVYKNPKLARTAYQYLYDMIMSKGTKKVEKYRKTYVHYSFFDDPEVPIFGLEETLHQLVQFFKGAAGGYGPERRVLLLHGPVGSSKSTILRCIKRGLEKYSLTDDGAWYTFKWVNLPTGKDDGLYTQPEDESPMHEDPLKLIPSEIRKEVLKELNEILADQTDEKEKINLYKLNVEGDLDPRSKKFMKELLVKYEGDWEKVIENHIRVIRKNHSESDRMGIATFQPKDEKNQDSTELTGDVNWGKLTHFGTDSDSRAFNFDGEFCFPAGTLVRMGDGSEKNIEDVKIGDEVVTHLGNVRSVIDTMNRKYTGEMVTLNVSHFPFPITMTADHPVAVMESSQNWRWKPGNLVWKKASDLNENDRVLIGWNRNCIDQVVDLSIYLDNFVSTFENGVEKVRIPTGEKKNVVNRYLHVTHSFARLFGLYLAEGNCTSKKVIFNLSAKEENLANEIILLVNSIFGVNATHRLVNKNKTGRIVEVNNVNLAKFFSKFCAGLAGTKRIPPVFMTSNESVKMGLISGWLDGDGHRKIKKIKGKPAMSITGVTISEKLARDISVLMLSSGMGSSSYARPAFENHKKAYVVGASGKKSLDIFEDFAEEVRQNGIELYETDVNRTVFGYARKIKSISFNNVSDLQVFDFEVEEDHSFLANDIVVHNCVGNRGVVEFIEVLKLAKEFLYDLLGASQERQIKPKKFPQISIDTVLISHTNNPEYEKLKSDQTMEALRDRTVKIDVPYLLRWSEELKILEYYYGRGRVKQHIAPHTLEIAALWTVLTRLQDDKDGKITLVEKAKLYDGRSLPGWTEDSIKELKDKYPDEGMFVGVSCRYTQDKISNCLSSHYDYINFFMVLNELKNGIDHQSLFTSEEEKSKYITCVDLARKELDQILKTEVQKALVGDETAIERLCGNYIDNVMAYIDGTKIKNPFTEQDQEPDERLMRSIEEKIDIPEVGADDFRRSLAGFIGHLAHSGKQFRWDSNPQLKKALEAKLFEDTKDHIKLSALNIKGAAVVDKDVQEKIDAVKQRLISQYGYNEQSATDVLDYVGSIFARGDVADND